MLHMRKELTKTAESMLRDTTGDSTVEKLAKKYYLV